MTKYRLNFAWNNYEKGYVFKINNDGKFYFKMKNGATSFLLKEEIDLLVMSGALTPLTEEKCHCNEPENGQVIKLNKTGHCTKCNKFYGVFSYTVEEKVESVHVHEWKYGEPIEVYVVSTPKRMEHQVTRFCTTCHEVEKINLKQRDEKNN